MKFHFYASSYYKVFPNYKGIVIIRDSTNDIAISEEQTIKVMPIWKWLLE